jgi:TPP-dependent 2-oxoacid decarboxylase
MILVEISLERVETLTGFDSKQITAQEFGDFYKAGITPTLLFLDPDGREIGRRLVGIANLELYGHYLQESIDEAQLAIRSGLPED